MTVEDECRSVGKQAQSHVCRVALFAAKKNGV